MSYDPHDPHNISADEFRKYAGLPKDIARDTKRIMSEEKVDLSTADIFQYIERVMYGHGYAEYGVKYATAPSMVGEKGDPSCYEVALSCCDALEKKGYDKGSLAKVRTYLTKMQAAHDAQRDATKAMNELSRERWDKNEVY